MSRYPLIKIKNTHSWYKWYGNLICCRAVVSYDLPMPSPVPTCCPVLASATLCDDLYTLLRSPCHAMSGTDTVYAATRACFLAFPWYRSLAAYAYQHTACRIPVYAYEYNWLSAVTYAILSYIIIMLSSNTYAILPY
eukprot:806580-Rhodomonas_salina.3